MVSVTLESCLLARQGHGNNIRVVLPISSDLDPIYIMSLASLPMAKYFVALTSYRGKCKGKVHPTTVHEGPDGGVHV